MVNMGVNSNLTIEQIKEKFLNLAELAYMDFYALAPLDTGFLRDHIKVETLQSIDGTYAFKISIVDVPYMEYTNEPWTRGRNPNQGWFEDVIQYIMDRIIREVSI